jgi:hypothetical protein
MRGVRLAISAAVLALGVAGCGSGDTSETTHKLAPIPKPVKRVPGEFVASGPLKIDLRPVGSMPASGTILYKKLPAGRALLKIRAEGLEPVSGPLRYVVWQFSSRYDMTIVTRARVGSDGRLSEDLKSSKFLFLFEREVKAQILITKVNAVRLARWMSRAKNPRFPKFVGEPVLRGSFVRLYNISAAERKEASS